MMAQLPERRRVTVAELVAMLSSVPSDAHVFLITECHGCGDWLDGLAYDADVHRVELTASQ